MRPSGPDKEVPPNFGQVASLVARLLPDERIQVLRLSHIEIRQASDAALSPPGVGRQIAYPGHLDTRVGDLAVVFHRAATDTNAADEVRRDHRRADLVNVRQRAARVGDLDSEDDEVIGQRAGPRDAVHTTGRCEVRQEQHFEIAVGIRQCDRICEREGQRIRLGRQAEAQHQNRRR